VNYAHVHGTPSVDDDEDRARRAAHAVTSLPGSAEDLRVVVLNISKLKQQPWLVEAETHLTAEDDLDESEVPESVDIASDILEEYGATVEKRFEHGNPPDRIIAVAAELMADGIVMWAQTERCWQSAFRKRHGTRAARGAASDSVDQGRLM